MTEAMREELLSDFARKKLEEEAKKNWDLFYKRNQTNFFKDRHWTKREFEELCEDPACTTSNNIPSKLILEAGCGVGNLIFPLLEDKATSYYINACDFSVRALDFIKSNPLYDDSRCNLFPCDLTQPSSLLEHLEPASMDVVTLVFVLSAIDPSKASDVIRNIAQVLCEGGVLLFRDYGLNDHAMSRFVSQQRRKKLGERWYVRQDGTRAYYFTTDEVCDLCVTCGLECVSCDYIYRETVNHKENVTVQRVFVQGKFVKR